ncbi:unnamed protein product [Brachionus calyciflorus]|uniref:BCL-11A-like CCHC zinc finger domain-containing protein n=1 Tax=Brachionus calyciflorus TaxID=104777 RepID=A0A814C3D9_9BILA|nr:unnamed protein product [Brachionus calyciflorus]
MEILSPLSSNLKAFNSYNNRPSTESLLDSNAADLLKCGSCLTEFLLSDIVYFIQHKTNSCKFNQKLTNNNQKNYETKVKYYHNYELEFNNYDQTILLVFNIYARLPLID